MALYNYTSMIVSFQECLKMAGINPSFKTVNRVVIIFKNASMPILYSNSSHSNRCCFASLLELTPHAVITQFLLSWPIEVNLKMYSLAGDKCAKFCRIYFGQFTCSNLLT